MHLCVLYRSQNKQRLFTHTALSDRLLQYGLNIFTAQ